MVISRKKSEWIAFEKDIVGSIRAVSELLSGDKPHIRGLYERKTPWFLDQGAIYGRESTRTTALTDVNLKTGTTPVMS